MFQSFTENNNVENRYQNEKILLIVLMLVVGLIYFFTNHENSPYEYTLRVGERFLQGKIGLPEIPPSYLNEMIPHKAYFYSAFPLGSILAYLPFTLLKVMGLVKENPSALAVGMLASGVFLLAWFISKEYDLTTPKRVLLSLAMPFGTFMWANLGYGGAWQIALGFAMVGTLGAIYFTIYQPKPLLAGFFFALAFGNRTEIVLTAPIFYYLWRQNEKEIETQLREVRETAEQPEEPKDSAKNESSDEMPKRPRTALISGYDLKNFAFFSIFPFLLGISTLYYNYLRFQSFGDFGYARIPGVLQEPWYRYGIFALSYIPLNFQEMLLTPWKTLPDFPYLVPNGFGGAIWLSSPFLIFLFRWKVDHKVVWRTAWVAIIILTFLLWTHGNPGGWQFSYRYAMVLLPWMFIILLENSKSKITLPEAIFYGISFLINAWAAFLFLRTDFMRP